MEKFIMIFKIEYINLIFDHINANNKAHLLPYKNIIKDDKTQSERKKTIPALSKVEEVKSPELKKESLKPPVENKEKVFHFDYL